MAYEGWLIKVGDYTIPEDKYMKADGYSVTRNVQDLDSYRDAFGVLHRTALEHAPLKVEFETPAMLTDRDFQSLMSRIRKNYTVESERKVRATVYVPELGRYVTQDMYMPDITTSVLWICRGVIHYNPIRIAFIGY